MRESVLTFELRGNIELCSALTASTAVKYVTISFWRTVKIFDSAKITT